MFFIFCLRCFWGSFSVFRIERAVSIFISTDIVLATTLIAVARCRRRPDLKEERKLVKEKEDAVRSEAAKDPFWSLLDRIDQWPQ